jgi:hypothetical protein
MGSKKPEQKAKKQTFKKVAYNINVFGFGPSLHCNTVSLGLQCKKTFLFSNLFYLLV